MSRRMLTIRRRIRRGTEGFEKKKKEKLEEAKGEIEESTEENVPLSNMDHVHAFWVNNGQTLHNLTDLAKALKSMSNDTFKHHVNKEKNDFYNWIRDIIKDDKLANDLAKSRNRTSAYKKVQARLSMLKKKAK